MKKSQKYILWFSEISKKDVSLVGGKNASLGEMFSKLSKKDIQIPDGFVLTSKAYWYFLKQNKIDKALKQTFKAFNPASIKSLQQTGKKARNLILRSEFPEDLKKEIIQSYKELSKKYKEKNISVAARSSATAEDLPSASFAGQHETYLNVSGQKNLLKAIKKCMASLFTDRAIAYREEKGFDHLKIALSVGIQKMIRTDLASSGVMFTIDTETGFPNVVLINSIYGVGEMIVKGKVIPDEFYVFKPCLGQGFKPIISKNLGKKDKKYLYNKKGGLKEVKVSQDEQLKFSLSDEEILTLAKWAVVIEKHYKMPQDIEWAKDGETNQLFIVQARPETVHTPKQEKIYEEYQIKSKNKPILRGIAIGDKIGQGRVRIIKNVSQISQFEKGEVLVTKMTDPDWVPAIRIASAVITDEGSKVCHAAIVSRELGIPCIVGTLKASKILKTGQIITADCSQGFGARIFSGKIPFKIKKYNLKRIPKLTSKIMLNIGAPEIAFKSSFLPQDGVGLAREEFIIAEKIRIHPLALYYYKEIQSSKAVLPGISNFIRSNENSKSALPEGIFGSNKSIIKQINKLTIGYKDKRKYFIDKLAEGIAIIAAAFYPKQVIVRFSDFKTNEYKNLIGGEMFENEEANPMLGFRGACRYLDKLFQPGFKMECQAIKKAREEFGLKNITVMVPFCRTLKEGREVIKLIKKYGLKSADDLKVYVMCEIPSNVILADKFLEIFDGMSIGSNDLTQLTLGIDRDNARIVYIADERDKAIKKMLAKVIALCRQEKKYCGICGQAPSDFPEFAEFLVKQKIESISLNPDTVIKTILNLAKIKK
ncbi:phosphoenolpyruvate synthase [Parcubacteria bacterium DG_74_2]|nr:MAG: phosphoenolpyruvate synthase [Parcubacteria bacterium DG_74_2]